MNGIKIKLFVLFIIISCSILQSLKLQGQSINDSTEYKYEQDTIHKKRLIAVSSISGAAYLTSSVALYNSWYKHYPRSGFHFFNDLNEWQNMDKLGHIYSAYFLGTTAYKLARWTGFKEDPSIWIGAISGIIFQSTIEIMDGFSSQWGFSVYDMGANILGSSLFVFQQKQWKEQRIQLKFSSWPTGEINSEIYSDTGSKSNLKDRYTHLYGKSFPERFLKDYNGQSYWVSFNLKSFFHSSKMPHWLNIALGYSAENLYGGFDNRWEVNDSNFNVEDEFPRYHQFLLGLDIDFSKITTKSEFLNMLLNLLNAYKLPMPSLEYNSLGEFKFHLIFKH